MSISELYALYCKYPNIITDSRIPVKQGIFFALQGEWFNGNDFANQALDNGCNFAVIDDPAVKFDSRFILVDNVLQTLQKLANWHRQSLTCPIIAITGTNGKTTTKELMISILQQEFKTAGTKGNLNNHIGVPVTLLSFPSDTEMGIIEMGANHPGEIDKLCHIAQPSHGLITNIGKAHLEGFGSLNGVLQAKTELYDYLSGSQGIIFAHSQNKLLTAYIKQKQYQNTIYYGSSSHDFCRGSVLVDYPFLRFTLSPSLKPGEQNEEVIDTRLYGTYNFENCLAASCIGMHFKIGLGKIKQAIEQYQPSNNRSQIVKTRSNTVFLDAYNANPTSVEQTIKGFMRSDQENKVIILGDMYELGEHALSEHRKIIDLVATLHISAAYFVGEQFCKLRHTSNFYFFQDVDKCKIRMEHYPLHDHTILIKGSRAMQLEKLLDVL